MSRVPLVFAGADYWDRTLVLIDGTVKPEGIELNWVLQYPGELFRRMIQGEFEAGEMSASFLVTMIARGENNLVGLPLFTSRAFRHGNCFIRTDKGIDKPEDMKGKRVGVPDYPMTSAVWTRGALHHEYGVTAADMEWFQGGLETPGFATRVAPDLPKEIRVTTIPNDRTIMEMFVNGEVDSIMGPVQPRAVLTDPNFRRLYPNHQEVEKEYYKRTGLFPITHMVVMRRDVYERHRWMPANLVQAFGRSKEIGWNQLRTHQAGNMPWLGNYVAEINSVFGGPPYKDGFEENYKVLDALTQYVHEQGLAKRKINPEEIFAPEVLKTAPH